MALPTGTSHGSGLSRSEAAILAWKKRARAAKPGALDPKIAARVKEILASKVKGKKGKAKAKGKKVDPAKAKAKAEKAKEAAAKKVEREKAKAERVTTAAARKQERETAKRERVAAHVAKQQEAAKKKQASLQAAHSKAKAKAQAAKEKTGARDKTNAERTAAAKQKQAEHDKAKVASDAVAKKKQAVAAQHKTRVLTEKIKRKEKLSASDQVDAEDAGLIKPAARPPAQAKKALDMDDIAIKAGARHSKMDASHLDEAARHLHAAGATCPDCAPDEEGADEGDTGDAEKAIKGIMDSPAYYAQHECGDIAQAGSALQTIAMLIGSELSEEDEDDADIGQLCDAARILIKFMASELDELEGAAGDAAEGRTAGDVPMAKAIPASKNMLLDAGYTWNGDVWVAPPSLISADDYLHTDGGAIKAIGDDDEIGGYAVLFGDATTHDMERDYYTKSTNFWLDHFGWPRPITYHHGMDAGTRDDPVIGHWTKAAVDDTGVWLSGQLDRAHAYYKAIKELANRGYLKLSSDSAPQWVQRERQPNGANFLKRWPLVTASATVTPMEPRMLPVEVKAFLAELGYEAIEGEEPQAIKSDSTRHDGVEVDDERARRILLELDILQLEETAQ